MNKPTREEILKVINTALWGFDQPTKPRAEACADAIMSILEPKPEVPEWQETINYIADSMKRLPPSRPNERLEFDGIEVTEYLTRFMKDQFKKMADELVNVVQFEHDGNATIFVHYVKESLRKRGVE